MPELIEVEALKDHWTGHADRGEVKQGDRYAVPAEAFPGLSRQKLVKRVAAKKADGD